PGPPAAARVGRRRPAGARRGAVLKAAHLERGDDGRAPGEAVRLDGRLVLAARILERIDGEAPDDGLAVRRDAVDPVGDDEVAPGAAAHPVRAAEGDHEAV